MGPAAGTSDEDDAAWQPPRWLSTNLVGLPSVLLASPHFNARPQPLCIAGARAAHRGLFALLERSADADEAREVFVHYMSLAFGLQPDPAPAATGAARRWRASYRRLLQGWGQDSNGAAGAVLKGWVGSRFGLAPSFHKAPLARFPSPAWVDYLEQKASSRYHNNAIEQQLDLVYEYTQWTLRRWPPPVDAGSDAAHLRLWRGVMAEELRPVPGTPQQRAPGLWRLTLRLNAVVSFTGDPEQAGCFGDWVLRAEVPRVKLLLRPGLLGPHTLAGEGEVLALGGDYEVEARYAGYAC